MTATVTHLSRGSERAGYGAHCGADLVPKARGSYLAIGNDEAIDCPTCLAEAKRRAATPEGARMVRGGWGLSGMCHVRS